jgi:hypothetical protein
MKTVLARAALVLLLSGGAALAQGGLQMPPSQAQLNAQTQGQLNNQNQQTQLNNLQTQQSNLENQQRQQNLYNSMPAPAYQQNQVTPITPAPRP